MNIEKILADYDAMFGKNSLQEIEDYLIFHIQAAKEQGQFGVAVTLLNEVIGFYRDTTQKEKALHYCEQLQTLLKEMQLEGRMDYATSLLNVANAYRAFGLLEKSLELYGIVENIYQKQIDSGEFLYASLYNNWSLLYQEMQEYEKARDMLLKALAIVDSYEDAIIEQATTRTNLAATLLQIDDDDEYDRALVYLKEALVIFEKDGGKDFHYGAALVVLGDAYDISSDYAKAAIYYQRGMEEIDKHVGKTDNYLRVAEKYEHALKLWRIGDGDLKLKNMDRCLLLYEAFGADMIHDKFPDYEDRIAVGLVGEGSDCFGFEDDISTDHDYGTGFCMWLTEADYEKIGEALQTEYEKLIRTYTEEKGENLFLQSRRGVFTINGFFNGLLGTDYDFEKEYTLDYDNLPPHRLATATNGLVFRDNLDLFRKTRQKLEMECPSEIWKKRLAQSLHDFSQYAQSNYSRMMARKDVITANLCIAKALEAVMDMVYALESVHAPYYKWKRKGMEELERSQELLVLMEKAATMPSQLAAWENVKYDARIPNKEDGCVVLFEEMAAFMLKEMSAADMVEGTDLFLEAYIPQILKGKNMDIIEKIVDEEWQQFDKVQNEGGRAGCQDDYKTFSIMRKSQYMAWPRELLKSFYEDLLDASRRGWNLITEKYARMMKSTAPEKYMELENQLPKLSEQRIAIQEEIIKLQVEWMEEFAGEYPKMARRARTIHTQNDTPFDTSYETYLRGELGTYSEITFLLYGRFIANLAKEGRNLAYEIMENTAELYGYFAVWEVEKELNA